MKKFAEIHVAFWPVVFDNSPDSIVAQIIWETETTIAFDKYGNGAPICTIEKTDGNLIATFAAESFDCETFNARPSHYGANGELLPEGAPQRALAETIERECKRAIAKRWTPELHAALVVAVADVLQSHGVHKADADESEGWTLDMVSEFAELMERQVNAIA